MPIELAPSEQNVWARESRSQSLKPSNEEIPAPMGRACGSAVSRRRDKAAWKGLTRAKSDRMASAFDLEDLRAASQGESAWGSTINHGRCGSDISCCEGDGCLFIIQRSTLRLNSEGIQLVKARNPFHAKALPMPQTLCVTYVSGLDSLQQGGLRPRRRRWQAFS